MPAPNAEDLEVFDLSPGIIKSTLKKRSPGSVPGDDGISYHHLKKLPSTHHFLATLFSKILFVNHTAPKSWCQAKVKLIPKGDASEPGNFRPIALTSTIGKLFNKIMACRLERFLRVNGLIDTSLQKGFLSNISGTMEHIFATSSIVQNAMHHGLPLSVTFLDLKNAFGSVSHQLIADMLDHVGVPVELRSYISSAYSQLTAYVACKKWSTSPFPIHRGVFQGDTLSPLIFLIAFNPVIQLAQSLSTLGFRLILPDSNQRELPKKAPTYMYCGTRCPLLLSTTPPNGLCSS